MRGRNNTNWIQIQRKVPHRMIFLDMAPKFVSYHFSLKIAFHAYTNYRIPRLRRLSLFSWESLVRSIYTPYQRILFDAKFHAEFEFEIKIFQKSIRKFRRVMSVRRCFWFKKKFLKKKFKNAILPVDFTAKTSVIFSCFTNDVLCVIGISCYEVNTLIRTYSLLTNCFLQIYLS